ncbi:MAG TPA: flagellar motor switch protein FliN [Planctomycetota bacterium]|nr:flagellar motor switch protein FliN [Planctomycetota bacterium]
MSEEERNAVETPAGGGESPETAIPEDEIQSLVEKAGAAEAGEEGLTPARFDDLGAGAPGAGAAGSIDMLMDVTLNVRIELGRTRMSVEEILNMQGGAVVTLEKLAGDFVDVLVNDRLVARGEVLILNDHFCVRIAEIVSPEERQDASAV